MLIIVIIPFASILLTLTKLKRGIVLNFVWLMSHVTTTKITLKELLNDKQNITFDEDQQIMGLHPTLLLLYSLSINMKGICLLICLLKKFE